MGAAAMIFQVLAEGHYRLADAAHGIEYDVDRLRRDRGELIGELAVSCGLVGARVIDDAILSIGTFNFSSPRTRQEHAKRLAERSRTNGKLDWHAQLEELCQRVIKAERTGQPAIVLRTLARPVADVDHDIDGFTFPQQHGTILFGDGGACKSLFALYLGGRLAERGVRVALFDWELDAAQHRLRLEALFGADRMPDVRYVRCDRPLIYEVDRLQRLRHQDQLDFLLYDSAGYACSAKPEDAEQALAYFRAVRQIGGGSLHIAHVNKSDNNEHKPYGSNFWHNSARSTWFVKLAATSANGTVSTIGLFHRKANLGPRQPALGFAVTFESARTRIDRVDVANVDELAASLPLWQRMKDALASGPQTLASLAHDLGAPVDSIDKTVRRKSHLFTKVSNFDDHITRIALVERRAS
jgi:hypothetical protein